MSQMWDRMNYYTQPLSYAQCCETYGNGARMYANMNRHGVGYPPPEAFEEGTGARSSGGGGKAFHYGGKPAGKGVGKGKGKPTGKAFEPLDALDD